MTGRCDRCGVPDRQHATECDREQLRLHRHAVRLAARRRLRRELLWSRGVRDRSELSGVLLE